MTDDGWRVEALPGIDEQVIPPDRVEGETLAERFARFHDLNPHVYVALRRLARDLVEAGRSRPAGRGSGSGCCSRCCGGSG